MLIDDVGSFNRDIQVAGLPNGGFVVAYADDSWGTAIDVTARMYNANGLASSGFILANSLINGASTLGHQDKPSLAVLPEGMFAVSWHTNGVQLVQAFNSFAVPVGNTFAISGNAFEGELTSLDGGVLAAAWGTVHTNGEDQKRHPHDDARAATLHHRGWQQRDARWFRRRDRRCHPRSWRQRFHQWARIGYSIRRSFRSTERRRLRGSRFRRRDRVVGPEGRDLLVRHRALQFADGTMDVANDGNALFDALYYLSRNPDVFHAGVDHARPLQQFRLAGRPRSECADRYVGISRGQQGRRRPASTRSITIISSAGTRGETPRPILTRRSI